MAVHLTELMTLIRMVDDESAGFRARSQAWRSERTNDTNVTLEFVTTYVPVLAEEDKTRLRGLMQLVQRIADAFEMQPVVDRLERLGVDLRQSVSCAAASVSLVTLSESIEDSLKYRRFYYYPVEKYRRVMLLEDEWAPALGAFPSVRGDAVSASECYALTQNAASVFHSMRVLEYGIGALAKAVGKTFDKQNWHNILDEIESGIAEIRGLRTSDHRKADLQFYSEAANEFRYFKDGWRNYVAHNRASYDDNDANKALEHTRSFMNHLATQLSE
ncbi:MAG: hypothetical protein KIT43_03285 [Bauldia sp.]|nr:hypothetical protein [Bauldia sp.]